MVKNPKDVNLPNNDTIWDLKTQNPWKLFTFNITLVILIFILGIFIGLLVRNRKMINELTLTRARAHFSSIVLTRRWNANYGGVYVEKKDDVISNPYLDNPDIETLDGKIFTLKNPALMTREISEYARTEGLLSYHITSLNPLNPYNKADDFESSALKEFEKGEVEVYKKYKEGDNYYFKYMAPLMTEKSCLKCHAKQGYTPGSVRGGISVKYDITDVTNTLKSDTYLFIIMAIVTLVILLGLIYFLISKLMTKLNEAMQKVKTLTGLLPICASCKNIRNDKGYWERMEGYIEDHSEAEFSHSLCPDCEKKLYPDDVDNDN